MPFDFLLMQREAELVKKKLFENQAAVGRGLKLVQQLQRHIGRRKMHEAQSVGAAGKIVSRLQRCRQCVSRSRRKVLQRAVDNPPQYARTDVANGFVDRHDAAHLSGVRCIRAKQFALRVDHFDSAGPPWIEILFAVHHDGLPVAEPPLQIATVKEFTS